MEESKELIKHNVYVTIKIGEHLFLKEIEGFIYASNYDVCDWLPNEFGMIETDNANIRFLVMDQKTKRGW